ncbi:ABC transporter ATP-binding protein [Streptomyces sp. NBC_01465]|uniref:ABC transporter ATP-binding protein n=1 Tax=Streptomyces sp. NBC_01465 TaxID=2903878 RepID=UPI002E37F06A|nr:ABC transporter ATP-binding protein [Streptomyces sp. NBC_01465]
MSAADTSTSTRLRLAGRLLLTTSPGLLLLTLLLTALEAACPLAAALFTTGLVDELTGQGKGAGTAGGNPHPLAWAAGLAAAGAVAAVLPHIDRTVRNTLARAVALAAQDRLYAAVCAQPGLAWYEDPARLDRLRQAQQCGQDIPFQLLESGTALVRGVLLLGGFATALAGVDPRLALLTAAGAVPQLLAEFKLAGEQAESARYLSAAERREIFFSMLLGAEPAAKEVRLFGAGDLLRRRMSDARRASDQTRQRLDRRSLALNALPVLVTSGVTAGTLLWAVARISAGALTAGDLMLVLAGSAAVQSGLGSLASSSADARHHLLVFSAYADLVTAPPQLVTTEPALPAQPLASPASPASPTSCVEFQDVWFRYGPDLPWILRGVTLRMEAGTSLGLVGVNGAGKSTLVKLLCRFYDPERGRILWNGTDLRRIRPEDLRSRLSVLFQDFMSYEMTATENIAIGDPGAAAHPGRIREAARRAGIDEVLSTLPGGYDTMLTRAFAAEGEQGTAESGVVLSGGQWQRVALARSLLRENRDLFVLDEPTASLDPVAQAEVATLIHGHGLGRTRLLVSHRLSEIRTADMIAVLDGGTVAEYGPHDELMRREGGLYATAFRAQAAGYQEREGAAR